MSISIRQISWLELTNSYKAWLNDLSMLTGLYIDLRTWQEITNKEKLFLAFEDERVVGYAVYIETLTPTKKTSFVEELRFNGNKEIQTSLTKHIESFALRTGFSFGQKNAT